MSTLLYHRDFTQDSPRNGGAGSLATAIGGGTDLDSSYQLDSSGNAVSTVTDFSGKDRNWFILPDGAGPVQDQLLVIRSPATSGGVTNQWLRALGSGVYNNAGRTRTGYWFYCAQSNGFVGINARDFATSLDTSILNSALFSAFTNDDLIFRAIVKGTSPTQLYVEVAKGSDPNNPIARWGGSNSSAPVQISNGHFALMSEDAVTYRFKEVWCYSYDGVISGSGTSATATNIPPIGSGLTVGTLALGATKPRKTAVSLAATAATNGTGTVSYRLHRSTTSNFTPSGTSPGSGTCIATPAAGSLATLTDSAVTPGTLYEYAVEAVDQFVPPGDTVTKRVKAYVPTNADKLVLALGDSTTQLGAFIAEANSSGGATDPQYSITYPGIVARVLSRVADAYAECINGGVSGYRITDFDPTTSGGKTAIDNALTTYAGRVTALSYAGLKLAIVRLGFNDSWNGTTQAQYITAGTRIVRYLFGDTSAGGPANTLATMDNVILAPLWYPTDGAHGGLWSAPQWPLFEQYNAALATIAATFAAGKVVVSSQGKTVNQMANWIVDETAEGLHPHSVMMSRLADIDAADINAIFNPPAAASGGGGFLEF